MNADTYREIFLRFLADGMSHAEAARQFSPLELSRAVHEECITDEVWINPETRKLETEDGRPSLLELQSLALREFQDEADMEQATELWVRGWTSEIPEPYRHNSKDPWRQCPVMSWYWRAPSKRPGKPGRRYLSTNQAFNAMRRAGTDA